jgi:hypothetical protein
MPEGIAGADLQASLEEDRMSSHLAVVVTQITANKDHILLTALVVAASAGVVTGALYRVAAAIIASFATVIAVIIIGGGEGWSVWRIALVAFGLITALQVGYLLGVALSFSGDKLRSAVAWIARRMATLNDTNQRKGVAKPPEG